MADKTEAPTPKRINEARERGQVARSMELNTAVGLLAAFYLWRSMAGPLFQTLVSLMHGSFLSLTAGELTLTAVGELFLRAVMQAGLALMPLMGGLALAGVVTGMSQTGGLFSTGQFSPNLGKLNPISGFQRLFSPHGLVELFKALAKVLLIGWVCYGPITNHLPELMSLSNLDLNGAMGILGQALSDLGMRGAGAYLVFAIADYIYQRRRWFDSLKMSKQEIIDELKRSEGDPQLKGRIRGQQRRIARQRMMQKVPQANVVVVNPTHLAVALQYDRSKMSAPKVVAKGALKVAERIVAIAKANGVPVVQNIPLARALYSGVQVDQEIPASLYQAVAEVLAFVYNLKNRVIQRPAAPRAARP